MKRQSLSDQTRINNKQRRRRSIVTSAAIIFLVWSVEYRESFEAGSRETGFGSPRLSTGTFKNEEFGRYTLYAYTNGEGAVVLKKGEKTLVIVGKNAEETKMIYETLKEKVQ